MLVAEEDIGRIVVEEVEEGTVRLLEEARALLVVVEVVGDLAIV
jgi:hypothetical protein